MRNRERTLTIGFVVIMIIVAIVYFAAFSITCQNAGGNLVFNIFSKDGFVCVNEDNIVIVP